MHIVFFYVIEQGQRLLKNIKTVRTVELRFAWEDEEWDEDAGEEQDEEEKEQED